MKKGKHRMSWALLLVMLLNLFYPIGMAYAVEVGEQLTDVVVEIRQNDTEIEAGGTLKSGDPVKVKIAFGVPVEGDQPTPDNPIKKGDSATFELSDDFKLVSSESMVLKMDTIIVGHINFSTDPSTKMVVANVIFDGDDEVFDGTYREVIAQFEAELEYDASGDGGNPGNHEVAILEKTYTVNVPDLPTEYEVTKTGAVDLENQIITWTVNIKATKGGVDTSLAGYQFSDDLQNVGTYVPSTFEVDGVSLSPQIKNNELKYDFPEGTTSPKTITFNTQIPDSAYYTNSKQAISNKAKLLNSDATLLEEGNYEVTFTPKWIEKSGVASDANSTGQYDPTNRSITWTIIANHMGKSLNNVVITDQLAADLDFQSAKWQAWTGTDWGGENTITPNENDEYVIGDINSKIRLIIVTKVPDETYTTGKKTYKNSASIRWDGWTGEDLGSGVASVGVGYNAISKSGTVDTENQKIHWTVTVDTREQNVPDMKVYDLLVYGDSIDLSTVTGIPDGVDYRDLTAQYGQKYAGNFTGAYTENVIPIIQEGIQVADLIEVTGLSTTEKNTFHFDSQVVDPNIFAGNKNSNVKNTATLFSGNTKLNTATGSVTYTNKMLLKEMLKREAMSDPAANVNEFTREGTGAFDYQEKTAIFRLNINGDGIDLPNTINKAGEKLGTVTLTDTLPEGWEFVDILSDVKYLIFEGTGQSNGRVLATDTTPDTVDGLVANISGRTATFTFSSLDQPYVILVKARISEDTLTGYFGSNKTSTARNQVTLETEKWSPGVGSYQDVTITSQILDKTTTRPIAGELHWSVEYKPYGIEQLGDRLEDQLPVGIELRRDASGKLLLEDNIEVYEMTFKADGSYGKGNPVTLEEGRNINYHSENRILQFIIPDNTKAYGFQYITDITGDSGTISNKVTLLGGNNKQEETSKDYSILDSDASASLKKNGWIGITKTNEEGNPLAGAEFTVFALDGTTVIRRGVTDSEGTLRLKGIPDGEYILRETVAPAGYSVEAVSHFLVVQTNGTEVTSSIDGKTGPNANTITIQNFLEGSVGNLTISKEVTGDGADTTKSFEFTLTLQGANGTYRYIGDGVPSGTISSGDTILLGHGQSITIIALPKDATYTVTEADYSDEGYTTTSTGAVGSIIADYTQVAAFTNKKTLETGPQEEPTDKDENGIPKTGDNQNSSLGKTLLMYFSLGLMVIIGIDVILRKKDFRQRS